MIGLFDWRILDPFWAQTGLPNNPKSCPKVVQKGVQNWSKFGFRFRTCFLEFDDPPSRPKSLQVRHFVSGGPEGQLRARGLGKHLKGNGKGERI